MKKKIDAIVIGSGAAGSVMTYELTRRGLEVVTLERGLRQDPQTFEHNELAMLPRLYKSGGLQTSVDHDLIVAQGQTVGGSTVINNAIWMRADLDRILSEWQAHSGAFIPKQALTSAYDELEKALHVSPVSPELANQGSQPFMHGGSALGIETEFLHNNRNQCIGCGWCNYGCRYNRKTSMLVTYLPWAEARGATILDGCDDVEITHTQGRATGVRFIRSGIPQSLDADRVVVCGGAIGSSAVLLRSGITQQGRVGRGLHVLGGVFVTAEMANRVNGFDGIGLTSVAHASPNREFLIESYFAPPAVFSLSLGGWFLTHFRRMSRYGYYADAGVLVATEPRGRVSLTKKKQPKIDLTYSAEEMNAVKKGIRALASIYFAGGAIKVLPATFDYIELTKPSDLDQLDILVRKPDDLLLGTAHPQGGNTMSDDPGRGVVDPQFRVFGFDNLYVTDASVFPTNIWANCQATVMAVSHYAASLIANPQS